VPTRTLKFVVILPDIAWGTLLITAHCFERTNILEIVNIDPKVHIPFVHVNTKMEIIFI